MAYASKYYDPVKAHEYYEKHKKLKGRQSRTSTKGLSDEGKMAAKAVKEAVMTERKEKYQKLKELLSAKIKEIKESMKGMSKEEIASAVNEARESFKRVKASIKEIYDEKYAQEMDQIKSDPSFAAPKKKRVSRKKKK